MRTIGTSHERIVRSQNRSFGDNIRLAYVKTIIREEPDTWQDCEPDAIFIAKLCRAVKPTSLHGEIFISVVSAATTALFSVISFTYLVSRAKSCI